MIRTLVDTPDDPKTPEAQIVDSNSSFLPFRIGMVYYVTGGLCYVKLRNYIKK